MGNGKCEIRIGTSGWHYDHWIGRLGERLGPILYQLPPSLHKDLARLDEFIASIPMPDRAVFEFRRASWYEQDAFDLLNERGAALCLHDMGEKAPPRLATGGMVYIRFHGTSGRYKGNYAASTLQDGARWTESQIGTARHLCVLQQRFWRPRRQQRPDSPADPGPVLSYKVGALIQARSRKCF